MPYTLFDANASNDTGRQVYQYDQTYALRVADYFRVDSRIAFRKNKPNFSWRLALDIQNLTDHSNPQRPYYDRWTGSLAYACNTGIIPAISYTVDF